MKLLLVLLFIFNHSELIAKDPTQLEKINFYPKVKSFIDASYRFQTLNITTPETAVRTKEVKNYQNSFSVSYAHNLKRVFVGFRSAYELATESAVISGIPSNDKYSSQGFKDPEVFILTRLRKQKNEKGNIDLYFSYADGMGQKEVGKSSANRGNGRNIFVSAISHGFHEEEWEFKNGLEWKFFDEGEEHNDFTQVTYRQGSFNIFTYTFTGQYQFDEWLFLNGSVGVRYRTDQKFNDGTSDKKEIQAGTGSLFRFGTKKPLTPYSIVDLYYEYERYSYFVKGIENFDGDATAHSVVLSYIYGI